MTKFAGIRCNLQQELPATFSRNCLQSSQEYTQQKKKVSGKTQAQKEKNTHAVKQAHQELIDLSRQFLDRSSQTLEKIAHLAHTLNLSDAALISSIHTFTDHAQRQMDQIERRVLQEQTIAHEEKVFSLFQPHTEWISKGKAGVPVELGLRVCVVEDQHQFILHHHVMENETDEQVAVPVIVKAKSMFSKLSSCSFDKGFHSQKNQEALKQQLDVVALKRKGKLSKKARDAQSSEEFKQAHHKHSAIESAINALEIHGLDKCRDHGIVGFKRYVALAMVARNIHRIGAMIDRKDKARLARARRRCRDGTLCLAA